MTQIDMQYYLCENALYQNKYLTMFYGKAYLKVKIYLLTYSHSTFSKITSPSDPFSNEWNEKYWRHSIKVVKIASHSIGDIFTESNKTLE